MDIVIISEFCESFSKSDNDRFLYIAKVLMNNPCNTVEIITSSFRHTTKEKRIKSAEQWPFTITYIEEPGYPKNVCLKRFQSHYVWGKHLIEYIKNRKKPDVVYCAVPSLTGPNMVAKYCEKESVRFIIDVQDLWPEAFRMIVNIPLISTIAFMPIKKIADGIYRRADAICAVSDTYCRRASRVNKKNSTATVFLGTELAIFDEYAACPPIFEKKDGEIWLAYCGTLGRSYDLTCVIDALAILDEKRIKFIVMGDGPQMDKFKNYAITKGVNVEFVGRLHYNTMCSLLKACDIAINPISHMAAQSIINKHADYAAAGKPVLNTQENEEYRNLVKEYKMGINCRNDDPEDLGENIRWLMEHDEEREQMGLNARKCAEERFDRKVTYKKIIDIIEGTSYV